MKLKEKIRNFYENENKLKLELLKEIRKEFDKYGKDTVNFHPNCEYDSNVELWGECCDLTCSYCSPYRMDKYCQIDTTARPDYIKLEDNELRLYCTGESDYLEWKYISLNKPSGELSVSDLSGLVEILKDPLIKQINGEKIEVTEQDEEYREIDKEELKKLLEEEQKKLEERLKELKDKLK